MIMTENDPTKSESSHSAARIQVFELQVDGGTASRVPSAKSFQDSIRSYSSSKIGGLAGLQPVLGRWNDDEREIMNAYLLGRIRGRTGNDAEADEKSPPESFREYLEEMLKTPKKLEEFVLKGYGVHYDSKYVETELRLLAEEARKAADDEGKKRLAASREKLHKGGNGSGIRLGLPDASSPTGTQLGQTSQSSFQGSDQDMYVVGIQLMKLKDLAGDQSPLDRILQTPDPSGASSQKQTGRGLKVPGMDGGGSWSPASSEILVHEGDLRSSPGTTTPSGWADMAFRATDMFRSPADLGIGQDARKAAKEPKRDFTTVADDFVGEGSKDTGGHEGAATTRAGFEDEQRAVMETKDRNISSETATEMESTDDGKGHGLVVDAPQHHETLSGRDSAKKQRSMKRRRSSSDAVQDSRKGREDSEKAHLVKTRAGPKPVDKLPLPLPTAEQEKSVKASSVPQSAAEAEEKVARKKVSPPRQLKTKLPRSMPSRSISSEEPGEKPRPEAVPATPEVVPIEHPVKEHALPDSKVHAEEPPPTVPIQPVAKVDLPPVAQEPSPAQPPAQPQDQQHHPPLMRQTLQDDIFFGFYFTRAFVFSYFRTKPSHYDPSRSVPLLKADALDATQRRLLKDLIENPSRYRCHKDLRDVERMQALAKKAERNSVATSSVVRLLHRLPNMLGNA